MRRPAKAPTTETAWKNRLLAAFGEVPGVLVWCQNAGKLVVNGPGGVYAIKLAPEGAADITGVGPGGVHIEVECKMSKGRNRAAQLHWAERMSGLGAVHFAAWYDASLTVEANVEAQVTRLRELLSARR